MTNPLNSGILLNRIQALQEDWDLSEDEAEQLDAISCLVRQQFPDRDVTTEDVDDLLFEHDIPQGFTLSEIRDLLFNA